MRWVLLCPLFSLIFSFPQASLAQTGRIEGPRAKASVKPELEESLFTARSDGSGALIDWTVAGSDRIVGFEVFRVSSKGIEKVNGMLVPGPAMKNGWDGAATLAFRYFDKQGTPGSVYYFETLYLDGSRTRSQTTSTLFETNLSSDYAREIAPYQLERATTSPDLSRSLVDLPKDLLDETLSSEQKPDTRMQRRLGSIAGVKIGIKQTGFYRVSAAELASAGFDTSSDRAKWQLFVDGNEVAINVDPAGQFIEFFGRGIDTPETNTRYFYLISGQGFGKRMERRSLRALGSNVTATRYDQTFESVERKQYVNNILNGDAENWWGRTIVDSPTSYDFELSGVDTSVANVTVRVAVQGFTTQAHQVALKLNGVSIGSIMGSGQTPASSTASVPASLLVEGTNSLELTSGGAGDIVLFDSIRISYPRRYLAVDGKTEFYTHNYKRSTVKGFATNSIRLFDITNPNASAEYSNLNVASDGQGFELRLPATRGRVFYAIENAAAETPFSVTPNYTSSLRNTANSAQLVIIYYRDYAEQAANWAAFREQQGITVKLVDAEDIYDEFSFGAKNWEAINAFFRYAKSSWAGAPSYALLIGGASENPKDYDLSPDDQGYNNDIPTRIVNTVYSETGSDEAMGDFDDDGLSEIAIGRIPGRTPENIQDALDKTIVWENGVRSLSRGTLFAYDIPDGYDFQAMSTRIRDVLPSGTGADMVGRGDANSHTALMASMSTGKYLVNYAGHGTTGIWASSSFFGSQHIAQLTNTTAPSTYTLLTCLNGYFLNLYGYSLGENLLEWPQRGGAAVWASTGKTTPDVQEVMATRFYTKVGEGNIQRLGDLILDAKQVLPNAHDVRVSWVLLGDPMLRMH